MELTFDILKAFALLPFAALLDVPFLRLTTRILSLRRLSFAATYMLALIVWGSQLVASMVVSLVLSALPVVAESIISIVLLLAISGWFAGYFVTTEERQSIGFAKGTQLVALSSLLFAAAILLLAVIIGGLFGAKP